MSIVDEEYKFHTLGSGDVWCTLLSYLILCYAIFVSTASLWRNVVQRSIASTALFFLRLLLASGNMSALRSTIENSRNKVVFSIVQFVSITKTTIVSKPTLILFSFFWRMTPLGPKPKYLCTWSHFITQKCFQLCWDPFPWLESNCLFLFLAYSCFPLISILI